MASKNIAIFHYQVGQTDGVSLEIEKWQAVFEKLGHQVFLCAGDLGSAEGTLIPEMFHHDPEVEAIAEATYKSLPDGDESAYRKKVYKQVSVLIVKLRAFVLANQIDVMVVQNIWSVGVHPALAMALEKIRVEFGLPTIAQHHDTYWERGDDKTLTCAAARELADGYLPPRGDGVQHIVINSLAKAELLARKGLEARVVPNIMNFGDTPWVLDEYNKDLRQKAGIADNDIVILQATRIVPRKGIELAIDVVCALKDLMTDGENVLYDGRTFSKDYRVVLLLAGYSRDEPTGEYVKKLRSKAAELGVELIFIEDMVGSERGANGAGKIYSLWDTYMIADLVTYPSLWEGWGNQLLEAIYAKLPIVIFEYPVDGADIAEVGLDLISLGDTISGYDERGLARVPAERVRTAASRARAMLCDQERRQQTVDQNFEKAMERFSMAALETTLAEELENLV